jgi:hypothetical protein
MIFEKTDEPPLIFYAHEPEKFFFERVKISFQRRRK